MDLNVDPAYGRYEWRDTGRGTWVRDADEPETFYAAIARQWEASGRSFFHMTGHLSLKVAVPAGQTQESVGQKLDDALAKAWLALRFHHPAIAAQVNFHPGADDSVGNFVKEYPVDPSGWFEKTFIRHTDGQTGGGFANSDPPAPLLPTLNVLAPPSEDGTVVLRDLVFRSPHDIIDGIGTLLLFDNYGRLAAEAFEKGDAYGPPSLQDPAVIKNLSPPFRVAANIPPEKSEAIKQRLANIEAEAKADASNVEDAVLPYKKGALVPGVHKRVEITLPSEQTSKLTQACKKLGVSVTHVFHAALALTLRDLQEKASSPRPVQYVGYLLRNERERCAPPYNDHRHPTGVYHSISGEKLVLGMTVPGQGAGLPNADEERTEFLRIVGQMRDFYTAVRDDREHYALAPYLWARGTPPLPRGGEKASTVPPPSESPSATISSMGRIDNVIAERHGAIEVYDPWVTGEELRSGLGLFLGTFRGELCLSAAYNDAWHDVDGVMGFIRRCVDIVYSGLGI